MLSKTTHGLIRCLRTTWSRLHACEQGIYHDGTEGAHSENMVECALRCYHVAFIYAVAVDLADHLGPDHVADHLGPYVYVHGAVKSHMMTMTSVHVPGHYLGIHRWNKSTSSTTRVHVLRMGNEVELSQLLCCEDCTLQSK